VFKENYGPPPVISRSPRCHLAFSRNRAMLSDLGYLGFRSAVAPALRVILSGTLGFVDYIAVRATVEDVIDAMWATDPREHLFVRDGWPGASCENVAVAVAATLEDRGLGQWTFVQASRPEELNGHAWLEWVEPDGITDFSIDPTLHQFDGHSGPFIEKGATPAAKEFTEVQYRGPIWEWPYLGTDEQIFRRLIRAVQEQLS
jgi:hypothetical protein